MLGSAQNHRDTNTFVRQPSNGRVKRDQNAGPAACIALYDRGLNAQELTKLSSCVVLVFVGNMARPRVARDKIVRIAVGIGSVANDR